MRLISERIKAVRVGKKMLGSELPTAKGAETGRRRPTKERRYKDDMTDQNRLIPNQRTEMGKEDTATSSRNLQQTNQLEGCWNELDAAERARRKELAAEAQRRRGQGAGKEKRSEWKNDVVRIVGGDRQNKWHLWESNGETYSGREEIDHVYGNENRKREGELDGNTVYWELKKG